MASPLKELTARAIAARDQATANRLAAHNRDKLGPGLDPLQITPGESFDLGATVDDVNLHAAGGYPTPDVPPNLTLDVPVLQPRTGKNAPQAKLMTVRITFTANNPGPLVVTPSGIDTNSIESVTLVASAAGVVQIGSNDGNAQSGAALPANAPLQLIPGVAVYARCLTPATTLDVFVVYRDQPANADPAE